jgi:spoIIIJ-associated protein
MAEDTGTETPEQVGETGNLDEIRSFMESFIKAAGMDVEILLFAERDALVVDLTGADEELLMDHGGETLNAYQTIIGKILPRKFGTTLRVLMDSKGYRCGREREIIEIAKLTAEKVRSSSQAYELSPMNPHERRMVHMALKEMDGVTTRSSGEDNHRHVMIIPGDEE